MVKQLINKVKPYLRSDDDLPINLRIEIKDLVKQQRDSDKYENIDYRNPSACFDILQVAYNKFAKQCIPITREHSKQVKEVVETLGLAVMQADGEAETLCAYMCVKGLVDAVLTEDSDVLVYKTPLFLCKYDPQKETVNMIKYNELLDQLNLSSEQFVDFCIMCSCDYNDRIKLPTKKGSTKITGIGPIKAYNLLLKHGSIENIEYMTELDTTPLIYQRCRELFSLPPMYDNIVLPYNMTVDWQRVDNLLNKYDCMFLMGQIKETWAPTNIIFDDDESITSSDSLSENHYVVYIDGSCLGNPGYGGWAASITSCNDQKVNILQGNCEYTTNNRMELQAAIEALEYIETVSDTSQKIQIFTDSTYVKNGITVTTKRIGWSQKKNVKNKDLWDQLIELDNKHQVEWNWVKAHNGNEGNEIVDKLARKQAEMLKM